MSITQAMCTSFKVDLFNEDQDLLADEIYIALYTSSANLDADIEAYTATGEVLDSAAGYDRPGKLLTGATVGTANKTASGGTAYVDFNNPEWTGATFTTAGALIYNKTVYNADNTKGSIAVLNFGGDFTVTAGTFRIVFPTPGAAGLIRID